MGNIGEFYRLKRNPGEGLCHVAGCPNRRTANGGITCAKHYMRWWRAAHPVNAAYSKLKCSARERGIDFSLTMAQFKRLIDGTEFAKHRRGKFTSLCLTVDRIDASGGYHFGNVQLLVHGENVAKGNRERHLPEHVQEILRRKRGEYTDPPYIPPPPGSDDPF